MFPAVTICSKNSFTKAAIAKTEDKMNIKGLEDLLRESFDVYIHSHRSINWSLPKYENLHALSSEQMEEMLKELSTYQPIQYTVTFATFAIAYLDVAAEFKYVLTEMGYCYQFNGDGKYTSINGGPGAGLTVWLDSHIDNYYFGPSSHASGFMVAVHQPGETPLLPVDVTTGVAPGTDVVVALKKTEIYREPPPANRGKADCFDSETNENPLSYYTNYSFTACMRECRTKYIVKHCGCRLLTQPGVDGAEVCKPEKMVSCGNVMDRAFYSREDGRRQCDCPGPCKDVIYESQLATYAYPNFKYIEGLGNPRLNAENPRANNHILTINYGRMSYNMVEEYVIYSWQDTIANLGGTLGLCVGASLLTICEFLQFGLFAFIRVVRKTMKKQPIRSHIQVAPANNNQHNSVGNI